jgi:hypothetical protein
MWARGPVTMDADALGRALAGLPRAAAGLGPWVIEETDGTLHATVIWSEPPALALEPDGAGGVRRVVVGPLRADVVTLDPREGRVHMVTEDPTRVPLVAEALAAAGVSDVATLVGRPAFTLRPLLDLGAEGIAAIDLPRGVRSVQVIACEIVEHEGGRFEARQKSAVARAIEALGARTGYAHRATFRFVFDGAPAPVDAYVELPNRLGLRDPRWTREVTEVLAILGVTRPGAAGDDVVTLGGGPRASFRFREAVGEEALLRLTAAGVLVTVPPSKTSTVATEDTRAWGQTMRPFALAHPLDEGNEYALADDLSVRARTVTEDQRRAWQIDLRRLVETMRADLGLDEGAPVALPDGALDVGSRGAQARVVYAISAAPEAGRALLGAAIARAVLPAHAVILAPRGRGLGRELSVELDLPEQLGLSSLRAKVEPVLATLGEVEPTPAPRATGGATPKAAKVRLSVPGTWSRYGTDLVIDGVPRVVQNAGFVLLLRAMLAAPRGRDARVAHALESASRIHVTLHRLHGALGDVLPAGSRVVHADQLATWLDPAVEVGAIAWGPLVRHPHPEVSKLARQQTRSR